MTDSVYKKKKKKKGKVKINMSSEINKRSWSAHDWLKKWSTIERNVQREGLVLSSPISSQ